MQQIPVYQSSISREFYPIENRIQWNKRRVWCTKIKLFSREDPALGCLHSRTFTITAALHYTSLFFPHQQVRYSKTEFSRYAPNVLTKHAIPGMLSLPLPRLYNHTSTQCRHFTLQMPPFTTATMLIQLPVPWRLTLDVDLPASSQ